MRDVYLVRHGIAEPRGGRMPDAERPLTSKGRDRLADVARGLSAMGVSFERLYTSPWLRAAQTAELLKPLVTGKVVVTPLLADSPSDELLATVQGRSVGLVGHEPWMSELLSMLCLGTDDLPVAFKKGGVAWVRGDLRRGGCELRAFIPPRVFRSDG